MIKYSPTVYLFLYLFLCRVHTVEILPKKIRAPFHLAAHALASLGAAASAYHMVSPAMTFMIVGIIIGVVSCGAGLLTWTFPESKSLQQPSNDEASAMLTVASKDPSLAVV